MLQCFASGSISLWRLLGKLRVLSMSHALPLSFFPPAGCCRSCGGAVGGAQRGSAAAAAGAVPAEL